MFCHKMIFIFQNSPFQVQVPPNPPENEDDLGAQKEINYSEEVLSSDEEIEELHQSGMSLEEFIEHVRVKGRRGLHDEYAEIKARAPSGTFNHARSFENSVKNRYSDVLCYDHSRVILKVENNESKSDYINANFVDGYKQNKAFIFSQGPLPRTFVDFWQLVWEQKVMVIVMTTKTIERHRQKCGQYWPEDVGESLIIGENKFIVTSTQLENCNEDFIVTFLGKKCFNSSEPVMWEFCQKMNYLKM